MKSLIVFAGKPAHRVPENVTILCRSLCSWSYSWHCMFNIGCRLPTTYIINLATTLAWSDFIPLLALSFSPQWCCAPAAMLRLSVVACGL